MNKKGQSGIILALVLLSIGLGIYLLYLKSSHYEVEQNLKEKEYVQDYGSSMLTSLLRSSTGNPLAGCEKVKDVIAKLYYVPQGGKCCGISTLTCEEYVYSIVSKKIDAIIGNAKKNYVYYFEFGKKSSPNPVILAYPLENENIKNCKCEKIVIEQKLISSEKETLSYPYAKLYIAEKDAYNKA